MNQLRIGRGRTKKIFASSGRTKKIVRNRYSYKAPVMVGTYVSTNDKYKFYNSIVYVISRGRGDFATKVWSLCARFVDMGSPNKTQVENGFSKLFDFLGTDHWCVGPSPIYPKGFGSSWWRRKLSQCKQPAYIISEGIKSFFFIHDYGPPILGWSKLQAHSHDL